MGYAVYEIGSDRFGGYGVSAICEHPECNEEIDRGMPYACGDEPFSEHGCDRYFCGKHKHYTCFKPDGSRCRHRKDCECEAVELCERCRDGKPPFPYKPEHPEWINHILTDKSWTQWRKNNKEIVKKYKTKIPSPHASGSEE